MKTLCTITLVCFSMLSSGQTLHWAKNAIGNQRDEANGVAVDRFGNSYITGMEKVHAAEEISVYPNPSSGIFSVSAPGNFSMRITDIAGRIVLDKAVCTSPEEIDMSVCTSGVYVISISEGTAQNAAHSVLYFTL